MGNTWVQDWVQSDWHKDYPIDKAIFDDFANFVRDNKIPLSDIMSAEYGKDKNGRKAIFFVQKMPTPRDSEVRIYILYYDKNNVRTKVKTWSDTLHC